jgi:Arc/MetJ-type ribon-helix-helix transcriptional regulator
MAKKGRPFEYQSEDERPVTVSLRLPRELYEQVQQRVQLRRTTLTEAIKDALRLWLETSADPRDIILSNDNTVIQEVQEMIRAAVQAEIGKLSDFMGPHFSTPGFIPTPEAPVEPVPDKPHNGNAVIQEKASRRPGRQSTLRQPIIDLLRAHPEGLRAKEISVLLKVDKTIGDTLQGMVRAGLLVKKGSGNAVRYQHVQSDDDQEVRVDDDQHVQSDDDQEVTAEGKDTRVRSKAKRRATSKAGVQ